MASSWRGSPSFAVYTKCLLENKTSAEQYLMLDSQISWHGYGDPPKVIQDKMIGEFKHNADAAGSIGGVAYVLQGNVIKWIIAWRNAEEEDNKVYTEILQGNEPIDWSRIKTNLDKAKCVSSDLEKYGYSAEVEIGEQEAAATLKATLIVSLPA